MKKLIAKIIHKTMLPILVGIFFGLCTYYFGFKDTCVIWGVTILIAVIYFSVVWLYFWASENK